MTLPKQDEEILLGAKPARPAIPASDMQILLGSAKPASPPTSTGLPDRDLQVLLGNERAARPQEPRTWPGELDLTKPVPQDLEGRVMYGLKMPLQPYIWGLKGLSTGVAGMLQGATGMTEALAKMELAPLGWFGADRWKNAAYQEINAVANPVNRVISKLAFPTEHVMDMLHGDNRFARTLRLVTEGVASQAPMWATIALTGGSSALIPFIESAVMEGGNAYLDLKQRGIDKPSIALTYGLPAGVLEMIEPVRIGGKLHLIPNSATRMLDMVMNGAEPLKKAILKGAAIEGGTEMLQQIWQDILEKGYGANISMAQMATDVLDSGVLGAIGGAIGEASTKIVEAGPPPEVDLPDLGEYQQRPTSPTGPATESPLQLIRKYDTKDLQKVLERGPSSQITQWVKTELQLRKLAGQKLRKDELEKIKNIGSVDDILKSPPEPDAGLRANIRYTKAALIKALQTGDAFDVTVAGQYLKKVDDMWTEKGWPASYTNQIAGLRRLAKTMADLGGQAWGTPAKPKQKPKPLSSNKAGLQALLPKIDQRLATIQAAGKEPLNRYIAYPPGQKGIPLTEAESQLHLYKVLTQSYGVDLDDAAQLVTKMPYAAGYIVSLPHDPTMKKRQVDNVLIRERRGNFTAPQTVKTSAGEVPGRIATFGGTHPLGPKEISLAQDGFKLSSVREVAGIIKKYEGDLFKAVRQDKVIGPHMKKYLDHIGVLEGPLLSKYLGFSIPGPGVKGKVQPLVGVSRMLYAHKSPFNEIPITVAHELAHAVALHTDSNAEFLGAYNRILQATSPTLVKMAEEIRDKLYEPTGNNTYRMRPEYVKELTEYARRWQMGLSDIVRRNAEAERPSDIVVAATNFWVAPRTTNKINPYLPMVGHSKSVLEMTHDEAVEDIKRRLTANGIVVTPAVELYIDELPRAVGWQLMGDRSLDLTKPHDQGILASWIQYDSPEYIDVREGLKDGKQELISTKSSYVRLLPVQPGSLDFWSEYFLRQVAQNGAVRRLAAVIKDHAEIFYKVLDAQRSFRGIISRQNEPPALAVNLESYDALGEYLPGVSENNKSIPVVYLFRSMAYRDPHALPEDIVETVIHELAHTFVAHAHYGTDQDFQLVYNKLLALLGSPYAPNTPSGRFAQEVRDALFHADGSLRPGLLGLYNDLRAHLRKEGTYELPDIGGKYGQQGTGAQAPTGVGTAAGVRTKRHAKAAGEAVAGVTEGAVVPRQTAEPGAEAAAGGTVEPGREAAGIGPETASGRAPAGSGTQGLEPVPRGDFPAAPPEYRAVIDVGYEPGHGEWDARTDLVDFLDANTDKLQVKLEDLLDEEGQDNVKRDSIRYNRLYGKAMTLVQLAEQNKHVKPLQDYLGTLRKGWRETTELRILADNVLRRWNALSKENMQRFSKFLQDVGRMSWHENRRLDPGEIVDIARKHQLTGAMLQLYTAMDKVLGVVLNQQEQAAVLLAQKRLGQYADIAIAQIRKDFARLRDRNYIPLARFGRYAVYLKARENMVYDGRNYKAGQVISWSAYENEKDALKMEQDLRSSTAGKKLEVGTYYLPESASTFLNFSPVLFDMIRGKLQLKPKQEEQLRELMYSMAPSHAFVKHLMRRRWVEGYSLDFQRAFASYMQHSANHIFRAKYGWQLEGHLEDMRNYVRTKTQGKERITGGRLIEAIADHYNDIMNPSTHMAALRSIAFLYFFGFVPRAMVMNATQVPIFTYPWLAKRYRGEGLADAFVTKALAKAMWDVSRSLRDGRFLTPDKRRIMDWAVKEGIVDQSYASVLAAISSGGIIRRKFLAGTQLGRMFQQGMEFSTYGFSLSEEWNRRVTVLAAYDVARANGLSGDALREFVRSAVNDSHFEYSSVYAAELMRSRASILFLFKTWTEHALYYTFTNKGGWRFMAMSLMLGGLTGIPLGEDLKDIINLLITVVKEALHKKDPHFDLETETREYVKKLGLNGDLLVHGLSRYSLGLTALSHPLGIPIPAVDFSASIAMGKVLPEIATLAKALHGEEGPRDAVLELLGDIGGVFGSRAITLSQAALSDSPAGIKAMRMAPLGLRNLMKVYYWVTHQGVVDRLGRKLLDVDLNNPAHIGEIIGQLMGFTPTRVGQMYEGREAAWENNQFYVAKRESIMLQYGLAVLNRDREGIAEGRRQVRLFNKTAPPQYRITFKQLQTSIRRRLYAESLRTMGLPTQHRYIPIYRYYRQLYGPSTGSPRQLAPAQ